MTTGKDNRLFHRGSTLTLASQITGAAADPATSARRLVDLIGLHALLLLQYECVGIAMGPPSLQQHQRFDYAGLDDYFRFSKTNYIIFFQRNKKSDFMMDNFVFLINIIIEQRGVHQLIATYFGFPTHELIQFPPNQLQPQRCRGRLPGLFINQFSIINTNDSSGSGGSNNNSR